MAIIEDAKISMLKYDVSLTQLVNLFSKKYDRNDTIQNLGKNQ